MLVLINTENLYIEGDNLEVLKILETKYAGKIKMIYIDPPYNTGNDFIYKDKFDTSKQEYLEDNGERDNEGNRLVKNMESNGRFHSDWLSMMYPRLIKARNLLSDDGVIFISIDDNEVENLKKICDEIFGEINFVGCITWRRQDGQTNIGNFARVKEYIAIYSKYPNLLIGRLPLSEKAKKDYQYKDEVGYYGRGRLREPVRGKYNYDIVSPSGVVCKGPWLISKSDFCKLEEQNLIHWPDKDGGSPRKKIYLNDMLDKGQIPNDFWGIEFGTNQRASLEVEALFEKRYFDFPKPVSLLKVLIGLGGYNKDSIILDFFSGSATTAHAVMQLNAEDGGHRKFIMVQLPEPCDEKSEAYKAGYRNICEIGKERIRRAGKKIWEEYSNASTREDALKPLLEEGNKRGGDRIRSLFSSVEQTSSQEDWIATQSSTARNDDDGTGDSNTLSLNKVCSSSVTLSTCKQVTSPQGEALGQSTLDIGFRVLRLDSSNMKDVFYRPRDLKKDDLLSYTSNIKEDRTDLDLLFQAMPEIAGADYDAKIDEITISNKKVFKVNNNYIVACFEESINEEVIREIAKLKPYHAIFRDSGFSNDSLLANLEQIFRIESPDTEITVL